MIIRNLYLGLNSDDYSIPSPPGSEFPFRVEKIVSDFSFQTDFFTLYLQWKLRNLKFKAAGFDTILIQGRSNPRGSPIIQEHFKTVVIEVPFDRKQYEELYPFENEYPLQGTLKPIEREAEFHEFLFSMVMNGLTKARNQQAPIPFDFLTDSLQDFKKAGYKTEWVHCRKTIAEYDMKAHLLCRITCNYFALELVVEEQNCEIFRKEILRTRPSVIAYEDELRDIGIENDCLVVTRDAGDKSNLFKAKLADIRRKTPQ